jgi:hypothetical protein
MTLAAPLALLPVAEKAGKAVATDLFVIKKTFYRERKIKVPADNKRGWRYERVFDPIEFEFHGSPQNLGVGALAGLLAIGVGWLAWNGVSSNFGQFVPGLKESTYWPAKVNKWTKGKAGGPPPGSPPADRCAAWKAQYNSFNVFNDPFGALRRDTRAKAKADGCAWAQ